MSEPFLRARTMRIVLRSRSATTLTTSQPSCDGSMWILNHGILVMILLFFLFGDRIIWSII